VYDLVLNTFSEMSDDELATKERDNMSDVDDSPKAGDNDSGAEGDRVKDEYVVLYVE